MTPGSAGLADILDDVADIVPALAAPWVGVLWLTAIPLRLSQAHWIAQLADLGPEAGRFGDRLGSLATWMTAAFLVALWGRAVFVRAVTLRLRAHAAPGAAAFRVSAAGLVSFFYVSLAIELASLVSLVSCVAIPVAILLSGLAAATMPLCERPSLTAPWREILRVLRRPVLLGGLLVVFGAGWLLAAANLYFAFAIGVWLMGAFPGFDVARYGALLALGNPRLVLVLLAGGALVVEPFWLGAMAIHVHRVHARESGDDLRLWFDRLRGETS